MKNLLRTIVLLAFLHFTQNSIAQTLYINEIMASNDNGITDATGGHEDWFEIYNAGNVAIDLGGYYVTDNSSELMKHKIPTTNSTETTIPAKGFKRFWASDVTTRGVLHVGFNLSAGGEELALVDPTGVNMIDLKVFGPQQTDVSFGRQPNGGEVWVYFSTSTPGATNAGGVVQIASISPPVFSSEAGFYNAQVSLQLQHSDPDVRIYYTLDGSEPVADEAKKYFAYKSKYRETGPPSDADFQTESYQSIRYLNGSPISITNEPARSNRLAAKASSVTDTPDYTTPGSIFKGTVVRARAFKSGFAPSAIVTKTYFVDPSGGPTYTMPVVSVVSNEKSFFEYNTGIYTPGVYYDSWRTNNPGTPSGACPIGNFGFAGDAFERDGNVEFFVNKQPVLNQEIAFRIHGGCTRANPRKTLRLYSKTEFNYGIFKEKPTLFSKRLLLRSSGNDWPTTIFRDAFYHKLVEHLPFDTQMSRPSVVFLNSEYWGIHNIRERFDGHYLAEKYGVDRDNIDMVTFDGYPQEDEGDLVSYNELMTFLNNNSVNGTTKYNELAEKIDIENFTDYQIAEIFCANSDWPNKNLKLWRNRVSYTSGAPLGRDGRWRWMLYDVDISLGLHNQANENNLASATVDGTTTKVLFRLLQNTTYVSFFVNRFADLLNTTFLPFHSDTVLTSYKAMYELGMPDHISRWKAPSTLTAWTNNVNVIRTFLSQRPAHIRNHLRTKFSSGVDRNLTVDVSDATKGHIKVNTIDLLNTTKGVADNPYPWTGIYFESVPVKLVAKPKAGYKLVRWEEGESTISTNVELTVNLTANRSIVAVFEIDPLFNSIPLSHKLSEGNYNFTSWAATSTAGTYPASMAFVSMVDEDPGLTSLIGGGLNVGEDFVTGAYSFTTSTRVNGLEENGVSFVNTGGSNNAGYYGKKVGGALLAVNTVGVADARVSWTGGTVAPNSRIYALRLQYRIGDSGDFKDVLESGNPEYIRNATAGHSQTFGPTLLPAEALGKPYVQLFWRYYLTTSGMSNRAELRLDDISVTTSSNPLPVVLTSFKAKELEKTVWLTWSTSMETNTSSFGVERSTTGKSWRTIASVPANVTSSSIINYSYSDTSPAFGQNLYRLKMEDKDGSYSYSSIESVRFSGNGGVKLFPNPVSDYVEIETEDWSSVSGIYLYDMAGRVLSRVERKSDSGQLPQKLDLRNFPSGIYRVGLIRFNGENTSHPVVLAH